MADDNNILELGLEPKRAGYTQRRGPLQEVVSAVNNADGTETVTLACGHTSKRVLNSTHRSKKARCVVCFAQSIAPPEPAATTNGTIGELVERAIAFAGDSGAVSMNMTIGAIRLEIKAERSPG